MPAPKNPNTGAARAMRAANARQRRLDAAATLLREAGYTVSEVEHNADYAAWARDEIAKHHSADSVSICYCNGAGRHVHDSNCPPLAVSEDEAQRSEVPEPHNADSAHPYVEGEDDFLCAECGGLFSDARHHKVAE